MEMKQQAGIALIGDVVGSRTHRDRAALQRTLEATLADLNELIVARQPLAPTVGDEFQAMYDDVATAIDVTLRLRLHLPDGLDCRFGLGAGTYAHVGSSPYGVMQDGPAWWAARDAIVVAKDREQRKNGTLRTWFCAEDQQGDHDIATINAHLLCRDQLVGSMSARRRRLLLGVIDNRTQTVLAQAEGISASAVSQALHASGAYAVLSARELIGAPA